MESVKVVSYGIGVIGRRLARHLLTKKGVEIVGAIDINPAIVGKDLGEVLGVDKLGVVISNDTDGVLSTTKPDIVCHTTMSYLRQTYDQFAQILKHGVNIVSTCEELAYPAWQYPQLARELDELARSSKRAAPLNSYCTVFASTEMLSRIRAGEPLEDLVLGAYESVIRRVTEMSQLRGTVVMTGGVVAYHPIVAEIMERETGTTVKVPPEPQLVGALGAALIARDIAREQEVKEE